MNTVHPLNTILGPKSIVIAGAGRNPAGMGRIQAVNVLRNGFPGEVLFLHPTETEMLGRPAFPHPDALPFVPELALLTTPRDVTPDILDALGQRGLRHAIVTTGGFREMGSAGEAAAQRLEEVTRRHGIRFLGPNCVGILNTHHPLNTTVLPSLTAPGSLSLVSQSGTFVSQIPLLLRDRGIRLGKALSVGNSTSIDLTDCLEYLVDDPQTSAIALYIEGIRDGARFVRVAREVSRHKPIVALYSGGTETGARAGASHTASLGGHGRVWAGLLEQAGIRQAGTVTELFEWSWALATMPLPKGPRVAILTHSGGPAVCMADECDRQGLEVPVFDETAQAALRPHVEPTASVRNPIDLTFSMDGKAFSHTLPEIVFEQDSVDMVLVHGMMDTGFAKEYLAIVSDLLPVPPETAIEALKLDLRRLFQLPEETGKPLLGSTFAWDDHAAQQFRDHDVPLVPCPHAIVRCAATLWAAARVQSRPAWEPPDASMTPALSALLPETEAGGEQRSVLDEIDSKAALRAAGVCIPEEAVVTTLGEAEQAAARLGYPVVLKGIPAGVAHKSEAGLVHVALGSLDALAAAWNVVEEAAPGCRRIVAPMLKGDRELVVGGLRLPEVGPCVMLGVGGRYTEAFGDVTFRSAPISRLEADAMVDSLRAASVFGAVRGTAPLDREQLADIVTAVGSLMATEPRVAEVDLNPLIVGPDGVPRVADALVVLAR